MVQTCAVNDHELHVAFYDRRDESTRLEREPRGVLERRRTQEILAQVLPATGTVYDVGGGAGVYAQWLAKQGYSVSLFDVVPRHIEQALVVAEQLEPGSRYRSELADARSIPRDDESADAVLLLGPLYHLHEPADRAKALAEARRVLKPGGLVIAAGISRYAWLMDAYRQQLADDPSTQASIADSLVTGYSTSDPAPGSFWAYFHRPEDLHTEVHGAGFVTRRCVAIEGFAWMLADLGEILASDERSANLMRHLRTVEAEPSIVGASAHFVVVANKPLTAGVES